MGKFDSFNKKVNLDSLQDQMAKAADQNGTGDFKDVEKGQYRVQLVKMEVGECGEKAKIPGAPLLKADFKILPSEEFGNKFKNSHQFFCQKTDMDFLPACQISVLCIFFCFAEYIIISLTVIAHIYFFSYH